MKNIFYFILSTCICTTFLISCKKSSSHKTTNTYTCTSCTTTPEAVAANDASSKGIYKGVLIGSTGTIKFDIDNAGTTISAVMIIDGVTVNLTSAVTWTAGQAYVAPFTGTMGGQPVTITFSVNLTGQTPAVTSSSIPGHPGADFTIIKETSTALIEGFEGTYTTSQSKTGTFNAILSIGLAKWGAVARDDGSTSINHVGGVISNSNLIDEHNTTIATVSGDQVSGKFTDSNGTVITVTGKRTL